ncbi:hypothetical protein E2C01_046646 [Portunus trituberculatus]|uniref:Uncharacterized protein n=1 Tax=Portunus trituberculatus TaxID=210409 RepID=A0A5B7G6Q7_PORTR|nr:hypothetical protein [Portunus trituberculatus]
MYGCAGEGWGSVDVCVGGEDRAVWVCFGGRREGAGECGCVLGRGQVRVCGGGIEERRKRRRRRGKEARGGAAGVGGAAAGLPPVNPLISPPHALILCVVNATYSSVSPQHHHLTNLSLMLDPPTPFQ